ncbi:MAG: acetoin dehydrogenase [Candidatus Binatia bacterium]|nr:MAG: acetoin dehydrogenase [Candidatus Binatia bacterium]
MLVGEHMTSPVITVAPHATVAEARRLMREHDIRHLPVIERSRLIGIVARSDLNWPSTARVPDEMPVAEVMSGNVIAVTPRTTMENAASLMLANKIGALPVVDEEEHVVGILTAADILSVFLDVMGVGSGARRIEIRLPDRPGALAPAVRCIGNLGVNIVSVVSAREQEGWRSLVLRLATDDLEPVLTALADLGVEVVSTGEGDD